MTLLVYCSLILEQMHTSVYIMIQKENRPKETWLFKFILNPSRELLSGGGLYSKEQTSVDPISLKLKNWG